MPRKNRGCVHAGVYHVWRRTAGRIDMFRDDDDRTDFCNRLAAVVAKHAWICLGFVLMPTHFHLVLELVEDDILQPGMHRLFGGYAQDFNRRWARSGHLKAEPYKHRLVADEADLENLVRYVARNPVRDGLCDRPRDWYWSSYPGTAGYASPFPFVLDTTVVACFHEERTKAIRQLRVFVEAE